MIRIKLRLICLATIFFSLYLNLLSSPLFAQKKVEAFDRMSIELNYLSNINQNTFHQFWQPSLGAELSIGFPFYAGTVKGGLHFLPYRAKDDPQIDFISQYYFVQWGFNLPIIDRFDWHNGLRIGSYRMDFDDDQINVTQQTESELAVGVTSVVILKISTTWRIRGSVDYIKVYTKKHLELTFVSAGFCFEFDTPAWLKEFLK